MNNVNAVIDGRLREHTEEHDLQHERSGFNMVEIAGSPGLGFLLLILTLVTALLLCLCAFWRCRQYCTKHFGIGRLLPNLNFPPFQLPQPPHFMQAMCPLPLQPFQQAPQPVPVPQPQVQIPLMAMPAPTAPPIYPAQPPAKLYNPQQFGV